VPLRRLRAQRRRRRPRRHGAAGDRSDPFQALLVENVAALDGAAVDVDLTAVVPPWAAAALMQINTVKDGAPESSPSHLGKTTRRRPRPRANLEHVYQLEGDAVIRIGNYEFSTPPDRPPRHLWRQRVSGGAAVLTNGSFW